MKALARSHVWWPNMDQDVEQTARERAACQEGRPAPPQAPLHPWEWPTMPMHRIHVDFAGPVQGKMLLVAYDAHSKWPEVLVMSSTTSGRTIGVLREMFARYGIPKQLVSDNGPQFTSSEFESFLRTNGVMHIKTSPYHPASNGCGKTGPNSQTIFASGMQTRSGPRAGLSSFPNAVPINTTCNNGGCPL